MNFRLQKHQLLGMRGRYLHICIKEDIWRQPRVLLVSPRDKVFTAGSARPPETEKYHHSVIFCIRGESWWTGHFDALKLLWQLHFIQMKRVWWNSFLSVNAGVTERWLWISWFSTRRTCSCGCVHSCILIICINDAPKLLYKAPCSAPFEESLTDRKSKK